MQTSARTSPESLDSLISKLARRTRMREDLVRAAITLLTFGPAAVGQLAVKFKEDQIAEMLGNQAMAAMQRENGQ
jgi:hypothetical protein